MEFTPILSPDTFWVGNTSRDQYLGVAFGLGVAWDMVGDQSVRNSITAIASRLVGFLTGHNWSVVMPNGTVSTTFLIRPDELLTMLQVGAHVDSSDFSSEYILQRDLLAATVAVPITVDVSSDSSYFKFNLDYISFYNLVRMDASAAHTLYKAAYDELRSATSGDENAFFNLIDYGLNGANAMRDQQSVMLIDQWLQRLRRDNSVNLANVVPTCGSSACGPIPVVLRPPDEFLWEESPYQLSGGGSGIIETAAIDYILPYWMARYYGVIGAVNVQSSAAPNGEVAPDSLGSIYGSNLTTQSDVTLTVTDSAGTARTASVSYVSPSQINFVVPDGTAAGTAQFTIASGNATVTATGLIQAVAPTLFSINGTGTGVAAANAIQVTTTNTTANSLAVPVFECSGSTCQATPLALNSASTTYLVLYGTGIHNRSSLTNVTATINGISVPVLYAGSQSTYDGLDQVNVSLPASLSGSGEVNVVLTVDGQTSNVVTVDIQ